MQWSNQSKENILKEPCENRDNYKTNAEEDDLATLNKLSLINADARYELLNVNKQILDFGLNLKVIKIFICF